MKILVWGCGNMASAFAIGLARREQGETYLCWNPSREKAEVLAKKLSGTVASTADIPDVDVVILGFKPQKLSEAAQALTSLKKNAIVISLLAAVGLEQLQLSFPGKKVIRVMPNLAVANGQGVVLWDTTQLSGDEVKTWENRFKELGLAPHVSEKLIDLYTLHSGCSPAFLYSWIDDAARFAQKNGGDADLAKKILIKSWQGALENLENDLTPMAQKVDAVASKGGVTRAVLNGFAEAAPDYIERGFAAGLKRLSEMRSQS